MIRLFPALLAWSTFGLLAPACSSGIDRELTDGLSISGAQYRGAPRKTGVAPAGSTVGGDLVQAWQSEPLAIGTYTASKGSPAVDDTQVYVGVDDGQIHALSRETGEVVWSYATHMAEVEADRAADGETDHRGIHGTPAVDDTQVYIGDYGGWMYALDKATGDLIWEADVGGSIGASPTLTSGLVVISVEFPTPDGKIVVLDATDGTVLWRSPFLGNHPHSSTAVDPATGRAYVGANNGRFFCFDLYTGEELWRAQLDGDIKSTPAVADGLAFITSWDHTLRAFDAATGEPAFTFEATDKSMSSPTVHDGVVWFGSHDDHLRAVDVATGEALWAYETAGSITSSPTYVPDTDVVMIGSRDNHLHLVDATTGDLLAKHRLTDDLTGVPVVVDDSVFVYDDAGVTWRFDAAE